MCSTTQKRSDTSLMSPLPQRQTAGASSLGPIQILTSCSGTGERWPIPRAPAQPSTSRDKPAQTEERNHIQPRASTAQSHGLDHSTHLLHGGPVESRACPAQAAHHRALPRSWSVQGSATPGAYSQQAGPLMRIQSHTSACDLLAAAHPRHGRSRKTPGFAKATSTSSTCKQSTSPLPPHKSARRLNPRLSNAWWRQQPPHAGRRPQVLGSLTYCIPRADSRRTMTQAPPHGESGAHQQHDST